MHSAFNRKNTGQYRGGLLVVFPDSAVVAQLAVNQLVVGSNPTLGASSKIVVWPYHLEV